MSNLKKTAIVYCDKQFGLLDGKTASGLVRHSDIYTILGIIDSSLAGQDAGEVLGIEKRNIPIFTDLDEALGMLSKVPDCYIYGKAPLDTILSAAERLLIFEAIEHGMDIISGLHELLSEDRDFVLMANRHDIQITDVRKPPRLKDLHVFSGLISRVNIPVIAILGTDCACGKRTTAVELNKALNKIGIKSVLVATGQSGLMQGAMYGVSMDALPSQFIIGEIENAVIQAFQNECPDIILVEGQSSVGHPAFMSSIGILKGSRPDRIILQHPPGRKLRCDFPNMAMPTVESEIKLIEVVSQAKVMAITLSHENLKDIEINQIISDYENRLHLPTTDVLGKGCQKLIQELGNHYPKLNQIKKQINYDDILVLETYAA